MMLRDAIGDIVAHIWFSKVFANIAHDESQQSGGPMRKTTIILALLFLSPTAVAATWAQFVLGEGYESVLMVSNKTAFPWQGTVKIFQGYNASWAGRWYVNGTEYTGSDAYPVSLPAYGTVRLFFTGDSSLQVGYMDFESGSSYSLIDVAYSFFYNLRINDNDLSETVGGPESPHNKKMVFGVEKSAQVDTGYAISPLSRSGATSFPIVLTLYNSDGSIYDTRQVTFLGHHAIFVSQVFSLPATFIGFLKVDSQQSIYLTVLRMEYNSTGWQFTSIAPDNYVIF
jgi:hypothetical protein